MVDATKRKVSVFTEAEKKNIIEEFEYYNVRKERSFDPEDGYVMPTDPFAEQMLSSTQNYGLKNVSSRSIILAPFNSTRSHLELDNDQSTILIGRALDNHVVLYSAVVSRRHLEIPIMIRVIGNWKI